MRNTDRINAQESSLNKKEILGEAVEQVKKAGVNLTQQAAERANEAKAEARKQIHHQKHEVVNQIHGVNDALRKTAVNVQNPALGDQIDKLADRVEQAADRLQEADLEEVLEAAEDFSRSQPTLFLTGSFFVGMMLARFLRASKSRELPAEATTDSRSMNGYSRPVSEVSHNDTLAAR